MSLCTDLFSFFLNLYIITIIIVIVVIIIIIITIIIIIIIITIIIIIIIISLHPSSATLDLILHSLFVQLTKLAIANPHSF